MSARSQFASLLSEAGLVVDFAVRRGKATPALLRSLRAAELEFASTNTIEQNLDNLMNEIQKTEISFPPGELIVRKLSVYLRDLIPRSIFYVVVFFVIVFTSLYTTQYIAIKNNVIHLQAIQSQNILDVAFRFWMMSPQMKLPSALLHEPPSATEKNLILEKLEQVTQLNDQIEVYRGDADKNLQAFNEDLLLSIIPSKINQFVTGFTPENYEFKGYPYLTSTSNGSAGGQGGDEAVVKRSKHLGHRGRVKSPALSIAPVPFGPTVSSIRDPRQSSNPLAAATPSGPVALAMSAPVSSDAPTESDYFENLHFHGIAQLLPANPNSPTVQPIESILNQEIQVKERYGQIVLPVLIGMLGAIVYHVRLMLNDPDALPGFWRINLRVLLGGLAGVSGSIFVSAMTREQNGPFSTGIWLFLLAFLLGFSLELFFTVLDRLVRFAEDRLKFKEEGGPAASTPPNPANPVASS